VGLEAIPLEIQTEFQMCNFGYNALVTREEDTTEQSRPLRGEPKAVNDVASWSSNQVL